MDLITSLTSQALGKALDGLSMRHKAIASNLANVDTPNYKRRDVSFEKTLQHALDEAQGRGPNAQQQQASNDAELSMRTTRPEHISQGGGLGINDLQPQFTEAEDVAYRNDGNGVDVESEMAQLAKNTQKYQAVSNLQSRTFRSLRSVINSGGG